MEKTFRIEYWEHLATTIDVVAETEEEALEKARDMVDGGKVNLDNMKLGDYGYESIGEVNNENSNDCCRD